MSDETIDRLAARGLLAGGVAAELAEPLARVRDALAAVVQELDQHSAKAKGPEPLPWTAVRGVRERLADAFLDVGRVARLAGDLAEIAAPTQAQGALAEVDVNEVVERAVQLARHRFGDVEVMVDLGTLPPLRGDGRLLAQAIAHLLLHAVAEAGGGRIVVRTSSSEDGVQVSIRHPARAGTPAPTFVELIRENVQAQGGQVRFVVDEDGALAEVALKVS